METAGLECIQKEHDARHGMLVLGTRTASATSRLSLGKEKQQFAIVPRSGCCRRLGQEPIMDVGTKMVCCNTRICGRCCAVLVKLVGLLQLR